MEYRSGRVKRLKLVLNVERGEDVLRIADGKMGAVRIIRRFLRAGCDYIRITAFVVLCKTVRRRLCWSCFEVVKVAVLLLIVGEALAHMIETFLCEVLSFLMSYVFSEPVCVQTCFVHADETDRREVIFEGAEITLCIRIKSFVEELCDYSSLDAERTRRNVHDVVKAFIEVFLVFRKICKTGKVYRHDADRTR